MTLADLAALGSLVSGFAVLASLVYLSLQVRQTERNQRALMNQGVISRGVSVGIYFTEPNVCNVWTRVLSGETEFAPSEIYQLNMSMRIQLLNLQDAFVQHSAGLIDNITFENALNITSSNMAQPIYRALWFRNRDTYAPGMRELVDRLIRQTALAKPVDFAGQLKADLAEVLR